MKRYEIKQLLRGCFWRNVYQFLDHIWIIALAVIIIAIARLAWC